jgi:hypothetical protein
MRRSPLHAYATCAVLLIGCKSPVAIDPPASSHVPDSSLSFEITGPSRIDTNDFYSWSAFAFGGSGTYEYNWLVTNRAGQHIMTAATSRLSLRAEAADGDLLLTLTVASGSRRRVGAVRVRNCIGGGCEAP